MTPSPHTEHRGINGRGYRMSGCPECELRYRMAWKPVEPPDSATESMAGVAWAVFSVLLVIFVLSSWLPLQPTPVPHMPAGVVVEVGR